MENRSRIWSIILLFLIIVNIAPFASAAPKEKDNSITIKIAVNRKSGARSFHQENQNGSYMEDYTNHLSYYAEMKKGIHLNFQFIEVDSEEEQMQMLEDKSVDFIEKIIYRESQADQIKEFTLNLIGGGVFYLSTLKEQKTLLYENAAQLQGSTIGALEGSEGIFMLEEYARENKFSYTLKTFFQESDMEKAAEEGTIAAAVTGGSSQEFCRRIAPIGKISFCLLANSDQEKITLIEEIQEELYRYEPYFDVRLTEQYFPGTKEGFDAFSEEETKYIKQGNVLRLAVCSNDRPNIYYDEKSGTFKGVYVELLKIITDYAGLRFKFIPCDSWNECFMKLKTDDADAILGIYGLKEVGEKWKLVFSKPLMTKYIVAVGESGSMNGEAKHTVGLTKDRSEEWSAYIQEYFPDWQELFYDSQDKCFEAVLNGLTNFTLIDTNDIQSSKLYSRYTSINAIPSLSREVNVVMGISQNIPEIFQRILNKSVDSLKTSDVVSCQMNYTGEYPIDLMHFIRNYMPYLLAIVLGVAAAFIAVMAVARHRKVYAEQKTAFFSNMSHEIRTPLNGIIGMTELAKRNMDSPERMKNYLNKIDSSSKHLLVLVNDILDLSKLEKKKMMVCQEVVEMGTLLCSVHQLYYTQAREKGIDYDTVIRGMEDEYFIGDYTRINQVLMNLLSNAIKFTPKGRKIRLLVEQKEKKGRIAKIRFSVGDQGIGIPKENLERIFNVYEQQGANTAGKYGGSGLGLSISRQLVKLMGGELSVRSEVNGGSEFYFTLSLPVEEQKEQKFSLKGRQAFVVDGNEECRGYLEMLLNKLEIGCLRAETKTEAENLWKRWNAEQNKEEIVYCLLNGESEKAIDIGKMFSEYFPENGRLIVYSPEEKQEHFPLKLAGFLQRPFFKSQLIQAFLQADENLEESAASRSLTGQGKTPAFSEKHILIVEDNDINREILAELLKETGCQIEEAVDGEEGVKKFADSPPGTYDLIFMDIQMPKLDGYAATRAIRSLKRPDAAAVIIVAMTANAFAEDVKLAKAAGMNQHLPKPVDIKKLYSVLKKYL